jgi:hypothetical protein
MSKTITALNTISGQVGQVPASYIDHPVLGQSLVEVPAGTKSYDPKFYKSTDKEGDAEKPTRGRRKSEDEAAAFLEDPFKTTLGSEVQ